MTGISVRDNDVTPEILLRNFGKGAQWIDSTAGQAVRWLAATLGGLIIKLAKTGVNTNHWRWVRQTWQASERIERATRELGKISNLTAQSVSSLSQATADCCQKLQEQTFMIEETVKNVEEKVMGVDRLQPRKPSATSEYPHRGLP